MFGLGRLSSSMSVNDKRYLRGPIKKQNALTQNEPRRAVYDGMSGPPMRRRKGDKNCMGF